MSLERRERQAAREADTAPRHTVFRVLEALLWVVVVALFAIRVAPQLRAAVGWSPAHAAEPAVSLQMLDGSTVPLGGLKGRVVLVNFWATWCPPCRAEMPGIEKVYEARRADGFTVVGISLDQTGPQEVESFLRNHAITYPVAMGDRAAVAGFGGVSSLPTSFLIDRKGQVRYTVQGMFAEVTLRAAVDRLLAERG
jgi:thiol-disulfide isomerase/thioredoxin